MTCARHSKAAGREDWGSGPSPMQVPKMAVEADGCVLCRATTHSSGQPVSTEQTRHPQRPPPTPATSTHGRGCALQLSLPHTVSLGGLVELFAFAGKSRA